MSSYTADKKELAARIKPSIEKAIDGDDFLKTYRSPVNGNPYNINPRLEVDIDADKPEKFFVWVPNSGLRERTMTFDEAIGFIALDVAASLIDAKESLLRACADLGLS